MGLLADLGIKFYTGNIYRWAPTWCTWLRLPGCAWTYWAWATVLQQPLSQGLSPSHPLSLACSRWQEILDVRLAPVNTVRISFLLSWQLHFQYMQHEWNTHLTVKKPQYMQYWYKKFLVLALHLAIYGKIWLEIEANSDWKFHQKTREYWFIMQGDYSIKIDLPICKTDLCHQTELSPNRNRRL